MKWPRKRRLRWPFWTSAVIALLLAVAISATYWREVGWVQTRLLGNGTCVLQWVAMADGELRYVSERVPSRHGDLQYGQDEIIHDRRYQQPPVTYNDMLSVLSWGGTTWNWRMPLWLAMLPFISFCAAYCLIPKRRRADGHCPHCGYDRTGIENDSVCPECGTSR